MLPTKPILQRKWQGHPLLCLKDLHLPHSAWLSCYVERAGGGGVEWGHFVQNSKGIPLCTLIPYTILSTAVIHLINKQCANDVKSARE